MLQQLFTYFSRTEHTLGFSCGALLARGYWRHRDIAERKRCSMVRHSVRYLLASGRTYGSG
jgi:hypothetical protein